MNEKQLIEAAYEHAHIAANLTDDLQEDKADQEAIDPEKIRSLLEHARGLNAAAQSLECIARGSPNPKQD